MRKIILFFFICILASLTFQVAEDAWVDSEIKIVQEGMREDSQGEDAIIGEILVKIQRLSPKNPKVWSLAGQYYFRRMQDSASNQDRLRWAKEASQASFRALECNPADRSLRAFYKKISRWQKIFSNSIMASNLYMALN